MAEMTRKQIQEMGVACYQLGLESPSQLVQHVRRSMTSGHWISEVDSSVSRAIEKVLVADWGSAFQALTHARRVMERL